jgi:hypothetical protein
MVVRLSHVWVRVRIFPWRVTETLTAISSVVTTNKNSAVCLFNTGLYIQTADTEGMVLRGGLCCLVRPALYWYFKQRRRNNDSGQHICPICNVSGLLGP